MRILETRVTDLRHDPDFDRVEAAVTLIVKQWPGQPARQIRLRTSQPVAGAEPVEQRLAADAVRLAHSFQAHRGRRPAAA